MYILRSNIFKPDSEASYYFSRYSIQVSVLHRPDDLQFSKALQKLALHLHILTGKHVVYFPLIDPPLDWVDAVKGKAGEDWWRHEIRFGGEFDDTLVSRLTSFFGLEWSDLPALVIAPSLWGGDYLTTPTNENLIENQLQVLTNLANTIERPPIELIEHGLQERFDQPVKRVNEDARALSVFYRFLENYKPHDYQGAESFWEILKNELSKVQPVLQNIRNYNIYDEKNDTSNQESIRRIFDQLIAPARIASLRYPERFLDSSYELPLLSLMEPDSQTTIKSARLVGTFIDFLDEQRKPDIKFGDYTAAAQGYWKAYENEMNYSLVQVERKCLGIDLNKYYVRYQPDFQREKSFIDTPKRINLNQKVEGKPRHKFLPLGDNWYVFKALLEDQRYLTLGFMDTLKNEYHFKITEEFQSAWKTIRDIRNEGSHNAPLGKGQYEQLIMTVRNSQAFPPLLLLKQQIVKSINTITDV